MSKKPKAKKQVPVEKKENKAAEENTAANNDNTYGGMPLRDLKKNLGCG